MSKFIALVALVGLSYSLFSLRAEGSTSTKSNRAAGTGYECVREVCDNPTQCVNFGPGGSPTNPVVQSERRAWTRKTRCGFSWSFNNNCSEPVTEDCYTVTGYSALNCGGTPEIPYGVDPTSYCGR